MAVDLLFDVSRAAIVFDVHSLLDISPGIATNLMLLDERKFFAKRLWFSLVYNILKGCVWWVSVRIF